MEVTFSDPEAPAELAVHHAQAAAGNREVAEQAVGVMRDALSGDVDFERLLLRAAAGAGKSYVLKRLVVDAIKHPNVDRVSVVAFTNKQTHPIARDLGLELGAHRVCLLVASGKAVDVPDAVKENVTVVSSPGEIPDEAAVIVSTVSKAGWNRGAALKSALEPAFNGDSPFDVLFVDEAWQVAEYLFDGVSRLAPLVVGVGDVGQLPPIEVGDNPWRGDPGYNPYRAWPTAHERDDSRTWVTDLPAVWRPNANQLNLWRAFYPDWDELHCVAAPGDRSLQFDPIDGAVGAIWRQVATGVPTLVEIDGLPEPESPDVDLPLVQAVESLIDALVAANVRLTAVTYDHAGSPTNQIRSQLRGAHDDPILAILATRNQAVDDATDVAARISARHGLGQNDLVVSTVDSWQGQTNGVTVAIHPLSGAAALDEFNSAFGRLAVTCTRATHGLLMVARPGIDELLADAPARPGTPIGEPGFRSLPRQTHERILMSFARAKIHLERLAPSIEEN